MPSFGRGEWAQVGWWEYSIDTPISKILFSDLHIFGYVHTPSASNLIPTYTSKEILNKSIRDTNENFIATLHGRN